MIMQGTRYEWHMTDVDQHEIAQVASQAALPLCVAHVLYTRGFKTKQAIHDFIISDTEKDVGDPYLLKDAEKAVKRINDAIKRKEKILIAGDYDVDGITSSALMLCCLLPLGADINFFLPHRVKDGYGLSCTTIERADSHGYSVIITVDNGISAFEPARLAKSKGIDLIITDHHRPQATVPDAFALVDPHQKECRYPYKFFAGVGVAFKLMSLLYSTLSLPLPDSVYELMLLGTVADVVPLTGENRFWVRYGLQQMMKRESYGLTILKRNARISKPLLSSLDIGFFITPQINALGRLEDARAGVKFLIGSDRSTTEEVGALLHSLNQERKDIERGIFQAIQQRITNGDIDPYASRSIIVAESHWPPGVIGLVAGKLAHTYNVPVILLHHTPQGLLKGSCRSVGSCDIFKALSSVKDMLLTFGGHPMAAGLSLHQENFDAFKQQIQSYFLSEISPEALVKNVVCDAPLLLTDMTQQLRMALHYLEPFGCGNSQPLFLIKQVTLLGTPELLKESHLKARIFSDGVIKPIIFFNRPDLYAWFLEHKDDAFHVVANITEQYWNGITSLQLEGIDVAAV